MARGHLAFPAQTHTRPAWEVPEELITLPGSKSRGLQQIYSFEKLGQNLGLRSYFKTVKDDVMIHWGDGESRNIGVPAFRIRNRFQNDSGWMTCGHSTRQSTIRLLYPPRKWGSGVNIVRGAHWDVFLYTNTRNSVGARGVKEAKMAIICVPPWDLSKLDLHDFAVSRTFAASELDLVPSESKTSKMHLLWAVVYEACGAANCSYFVLTRDYWVSGNISREHTTASVSPVFDFSEPDPTYREPNLLQLLTYWELLSIGAINWDSARD